MVSLRHALHLFLLENILFYYSPNVSKALALVVILSTRIVAIKCLILTMTRIMTEEREDFHYNADNVDDGGGRGHDNYDEVEVADDG